MKNDILLTVAIPTYNRCTYLKECLESLTSQNTHGVEILVSDNASDDGTYEYMVEVCTKYTCITYIRQGQNIGPDGNFLFCLKNAKGQYVQLLGDDDILFPQSLKHITAYLRSNEFSVIALNLVGFEGVYPPGDICPKTQTYHTDEDIIFMDKNDFLDFVGINITNMSLLIYQKKLIEQIISPEKYLGTNLLQAHLAIESIARGVKYLLISEVHVGARHNNSGGYDFFKVFAYEWKKVLFKTGGYMKFESRVLHKIFQRTIRKTLFYWVIHLKIDIHSFPKADKWILFSNTWMYWDSWIFLYPPLVIHRKILHHVVECYRKVGIHQKSEKDREQK